MNFDAKITELFIDLPEPASLPSGVAHTVQVGKILYVGGVLPFSEGKISVKGRVGLEVEPDGAKRAARIAAVNALSVIAAECGGTLNKIKRFVQITGYIASGGEFRNHIKALDGASELISQIFGPAGVHTRNAIGCSCLPHDACIELSLIVEMK